MYPKAPENIHIKKPEKVISENLPNYGGEVICSCEHQFKHGDSLNLVEWQGFIVPMCPECNAVPSSNTRRMD